MNKKNIILILVILLLGSFACIFFLNEDEVVYTAEERKWISENKEQIFFMGYYNSPGEARFVKKLCQILSKKTALKIVPYDDTWDNTMWLLKKGKLPMSSTMNITTERLKYIDYTTPFKGLSAGIYSTFNNPIDQYEDIKGKSIGVVKGVEFINLFQRRYKGIPINVVLYDDIASMIQALKSCEIDGYISTKNYDESTCDFYYFSIPSISKNNNYIGIHKDYPELYSIIAKEVDYLIEIGWDDAIKEAISFEIEKQHLPFNEVERSYLDTKPIITVGIIEGNILSGYKKDYLVNGIIPNVLKKVEFLTGIDFEYVLDNYDHLLENEHVDLIATVEKDNEKYIYSNPIFSYEISVLGKKNMIFIKEVYDLEPYSVGVLDDGPENKYLIEQMPKINIKEYIGLTELLNSVEAWTSEYVLLPNILADACLVQFKGVSRKGILYERFNYMMAKDYKNITLINVINKCLTVMDMDSIIQEEIEDLVSNKTDTRVALIIKIGGILMLMSIAIHLIIERRSARLKIMYIDRATGVNNRLWLEKKLKKDIKKYTFFSVKLKGLFLLHECYGKAIYEKALRTAIKSMQENLKGKDIFAVIDKEKFVIAKANTTDAEAEVFARDLERLFGEKILIYDMSYNLKGIVGWITIEDDINHFDEVIEYLNIATHFSEKEGRAVRYSYDIFSKYKDGFEFDKQFVRAVMHEKLKVIYKNVYDKKGEVFALDTSATCYLKDYGFLNNKTFYEATKRLNLESQVDVIMLKNTIKQMGEWKKQGEKIRVLVSLSDETIARESFVSWLRDMMEGLEGMKLLIKLEGETLENHMENLLFVDCERIDFIVKNFGSDVLSMVEAQGSPADIVCIDKDFILNIGEDELYDQALDYAISMAKKMDKSIMVTNINSKNQYDIIITRDIDYISGNYIKSYVRGDDISNEDTNC